MIVSIIVFLLINQFQINGVPLSQDVSSASDAASKNTGIADDILFPPDMPMARGVAMRGNSVRWTNGIMPYEFSPGFALSEETFIIQTMQKMESLLAMSGFTCIHFRPRNATDVYYITFRNAPGCTSYVGQNTGMTFIRYVTLQHPGCIYEGTIMHELLHALGFYHEQSRPDRDTYIRINYTNIQTGKESNFDKYNLTYVDTLNTSYDYDSVMHYGNYAFSSNGFQTIETIPPNITIGQPNISATDILEVRLLYNCSASGTLLPAATNTTLPNIYVVNTTASSALTSSDPLFARYNWGTQTYYYHIYSLVVPVNGYYSIMTDYANDSYGYIYYPSFNASVPSNNLIAYDDNSGGNSQFQIIMNLGTNRTYMVVVTSYGRNKTGPYTLIVSGLYGVTLTRIYESDPVTDTNSATTDANAESRRIVIIIVVVVVVTVLALVLTVLALQRCINRKNRIKGK